MRAATVILAVFAAIWAAMALSDVRAPGWTLIGPALVSAALATALFRHTPTERRDAAEGRRIGRLVALASTIQGLAILVGLSVVAAIGRPELSAAVVAAVVGLHFLPLARWIPVRVYYATAAGLLAVAAAGLAVAPEVSNAVVSAGAALVLWATIASFFAVRRPQLAPA